MQRPEDETLIAALQAFDLTQLTSVGSPLASLAGQHPVLREAVGKLLINMLTAQHIQEHLLSDRMLALMRAGLSPADALRAVQQFVQEPITDLLSVQCVHGITVDRTIELSPQLSIVRPDDVPACRYREKFFVFSNGKMPGWGGFFDPPRATAAIIFKSEFNPAIRGAELDATYGDWMIQRHDEVSEGIGKTFISLVASGLPVELGFRFSLAVNPGYLGGEDSGVVWSSTPTPHRKTEEVDALKCKEVFDQAGTFSAPGELARLASRLSRARTQRDPVDAHLDFGIVAESLLTHGEREQGEIRFRLSTRAGWLLGKDQASRSNYARRMRRLYDLRSSAAHDGRLPTGRNAWSQADRDDCDQLCTELVRRVLRDGKFPEEWHDLIFGG